MSHKEGQSEIERERSMKGANLKSLIYYIERERELRREKQREKPDNER